MRRLINSSNHNMAEAVSNLIFDFIKKYSGKNVNIFSISKGMGFVWSNGSYAYEIRLTSKEVEVRKKLPGGTIKHTEASFSGAIRLTERVLKEIERIF